MAKAKSKRNTITIIDRNVARSASEPFKHYRGDAKIAEPAKKPHKSVPKPRKGKR